MSSIRVKVPAGKLRLAYYEDLTTLPVAANVDSIVKSAATRRGSVEEVVAMVESDDIEVALMPVYNFLQHPKMVLIPATCIGTLGASHIFFLFSKVLPGEIRRVLVDKTDHGAAALAKIVFPKKLMSNPEFYQSEVPLNPATYDLTQNDGFDAYVLVGKHCLMTRKDAFAFTWDLTQAWYDYTQTPYIIHCWATRKGINLGPIDRELADVAKRNEANVEEMANKEAERQEFASATAIRAVMTRGMFTRFDSTTITSIRRYARELIQARLAPNHPVALYTPPKR